MKNNKSCELLECVVKPGVKWAALFLSFCSLLRKCASCRLFSGFCWVFLGGFCSFVCFLFHKLSCSPSSRVGRGNSFSLGSSSLVLEYTGTCLGLRGYGEAGENITGVPRWEWSSKDGKGRCFWFHWVCWGNPFPPHWASGKGLGFACSLPCPSVSFALSSSPCDSIPLHLGWGQRWRSGVKQPSSPEHFPNSLWNRCDGRSEVHLLKRSQGLLVLLTAIILGGGHTSLRPTDQQFSWTLLNKPLVPHSSCSFGGWGPPRLSLPFLSLKCCMLPIPLPFPSLVSLCMGKEKNHQGPLSKSKGLCCSQHYSHSRTCSLFPSSINTTVISSGMLY